MKFGAIDAICDLFHKYKEEVLVVKELCWVLSNFAAIHDQNVLILMLKSMKIIGLITECLQMQSIIVNKEAVHILCNILGLGGFATLKIAIRKTFS